MRSGSGFFQHGHTYLGHPVACAAALAVQQVIARDQLLPHVQKQSIVLQQLLTQAFADHPHVGDIRGRGFFWGLELVQDRGTQQWFDPERQMHAKIKAAAMNQGLMVYPMGGTVDGHHGDHILLAPPFIATETDLQAIVQRLHDAMAQVFASGH
jgi:adenosylmethionine-8-amino-7-oxononanoate aminotransferase